MFSPEMIAGMLGIQPAQIEQMKVVVPQVMQAAYDSNQRLIRMEAELMAQRGALASIAEALGELARTQRVLAQVADDPADDETAAPQMPAALIGGH
jgi:DNA-binding ferritin-like protein